MYKIKNLLLSVALVFVTFNACSQSNSASIENISASKAFTLIQKSLKDKSSNLVVLDVRTLGEFKTGYIKSATHLNFHSPSFHGKIKKLDKNKTYLVYCQSGYRSKLTANMMEPLRFSKVYNLIGGINAWRSHHLALQSP